jgi:hypothetical protein
MCRRFLASCFILSLFAAVAWAADPFLGTWTADMAKFRQQVKDLPPGAIGDTFKVEAYKSGYKITQSIGGKFAYVTTVDFAEGVTRVHDAQGQEIDRVKVVRKSATEIETTSQETGVTFDYRILPGGNEIEIKIFNRKDGKPPLTAYYKRVS